MKKLKFIMFFVVPFALVVAIVTMAVLPLVFNRDVSQKTKNLTAEERASGSESSDSGASEADRSLKGGAIYLEPYATYTMNGGTISGSSNTYGGAVFISTGATFTMNGGTISGCSAKYGGGIYVSTGATLTIKAGTITKCTAEQGPAIYIEDGAKVDIDENANISKNEIYQYKKGPITEIGPEETMGGSYNGVDSTVKLRTVYFGTYPQTYVGDAMNTTLENWYSGKTKEKTYTIRDAQVWDAYEYTDGQLYARGSSYPYSTSYKYKDGTTIKAKGKAVWFKVEPIKWYIMNYDAWQNEGEDIELMSELALTSYIRFDDATSSWTDSELQTWLNGNFYNSAFDESEKTAIKLTANKNSRTGYEYLEEPDTWTGEITNDHVYCTTFYEVSHGMFVNEENAGNGYASRQCSPSDFALSNNCSMSTSYTTNYRTGTCNWWLRSAGFKIEPNFLPVMKRAASGPPAACGVSSSGYIGESTAYWFNNCYSVTSSSTATRPVLHLSA